jgi:hypothetical protein
MYRIIDTYGTHKTCWTWAEALAWLAACSPEALVVHRLTGAFLAGRSFTKA